jgi:hypothetical protein
VGGLVPVTASARFHANASVATDDQDRVWVAYEEGEENWGKDTGFLLGSEGPGLLRTRRIRFAVWSEGKWLEPHSDLNQARHLLMQTSVIQSPNLISDGKGHMWVVYLPRTYAMQKQTLLAFLARWEILASYYSGDKWSSPMTVPESASRQEAPLAVAADAEGKIWVAGVTDPRAAISHLQAGEANVIVACLPRAASTTAIDLGPRSAEPPTRSASEPREREQLARIRDYTVQSGGKTYKIYRGDMHRHTEISGDGGGDGSLWDAYRYALDAANLDYLAVTDHNSGEHKEYPWWRIEKSADMFHVSGFFIALFGSERGLNFPNGHRNVVFAQRGVRTLPISDEERTGKIATGSVLYPYLRTNRGIAMSHTPSTNFMGTDWRDNDPEVEPLVELFQGARYSAEHEGAPLSVTDRSDVQFGEAGGFQPHGTVWKAWAKGYKLGVQASSDHISTHISYACILAENGTREALLDAMHRRHSYGATSNIIMDFRLRDGPKEYLTGDEASIRNQPELIVTIIGTAPIRKVDIIRNNAYVYSREASGEQIEFSYRDTSLTKGEYYYYVRVEQRDGNVAWASPIWVKF